MSNNSEKTASKSFLWPRTYSYSSFTAEKNSEETLIDRSSFSKIGI